jgi:hypothetical protein
MFLCIRYVQDLCNVRYELDFMWAHVAKYKVLILLL